MCHLMVQPKLVEVLAKFLSLASDTSMWELTALMFNLIVCLTLLFGFETKVLAHRGTAGRYHCLHYGICHAIWHWPTCMQP